MKCRIFLALLTFILFASGLAQAQEEARLRAMAVDAAQSGDMDSAFMHFRSLITNYPHSRYREKALFAVAEYYFVRADYYDAAPAFMSFVNEYPRAKGTIFALAYLLSIARIQGKESIAQDLEKQIVTSRQQVFLFKDSKNYTYTSPLCRRHALVHSIDKLEFYADGTLFAYISY